MKTALLYFAVCLIAGIGFTAGAQEIHFRFDPTDGFPAYISTLKSTQTTDMGALGKRTRISEGRARITTEKTSDGYSVTFAPISFTMTENGEPVENPILSFVQDITMTYELDTNGELVEIRGFEGLVEKLKASLPDELPPNVAKLINEQALRNKAVQEWEARIGQFVGADVEIGDVWAGVEETPLPLGGSMAFYSVTKFAEQVKFDGVDCVRVEFSFNTDADELKDFMGDVWEELADMVGTDEIPSVSNTEVTGKGERIIDPTTMLIYSETTDRTIKMTTNVLGRGAVEMVMVEKREYGYEKISQ